METAPLVDIYSVAQDLMRMVLWIMVGVLLFIAGGLVCFPVLLWKSIRELEKLPDIQQEKLIM